VGVKAREEVEDRAERTRVFIEEEDAKREAAVPENAAKGLWEIDEGVLENSIAITLIDAIATVRKLDAMAHWCQGFRREAMTSVHQHELAKLHGMMDTLVAIYGHEEVERLLNQLHRQLDQQDFRE
jgi:hypothetical protein